MAISDTVEPKQLIILHDLKHIYWPFCTGISSCIEERCLGRNMEALWPGPVKAYNSIMCEDGGADCLLGALVSGLGGQ